MMPLTMLKRGGLPLIAALLGGHGAVAQTAPATIRLLPEDAQRGLSGHQHNFYFLPPGQTGEAYQDAGFFGQRLRPYYANNPEALGQLAAYRRQKTLFLLDRMVAVGALGVYGGLVFEKDKFPQYASSPQLVAGGVFVASILSTLFINRRTNGYLQQSVAAYNAGKAQGAAPLLRRLRPTTWGLGGNPGSGGGATLALSWRW